MDPNKLNQIKQTVKRWEINPNISITNEKKTESGQNWTLKNDTRIFDGKIPHSQSNIYLRRYEKQREELNTSHLIGTSL